jgi:diacylglycerol kinase (ATP)
MRARLIVNPTSGANRAQELLPLVAARLGTIVRDLDITITTARDDVLRAAGRAVAEQCDMLYIAGGDGTINAALAGLDAAGGLGLMPIGVIPFGTGNDFPKALGLGEEPQAALEMLLDTRILDVDVCMLNDRPFVNTSAGGFIADVSHVVTERLKDKTGKLAYIIGGARALLGSEPFAARLVVDGSVAASGEWAGEDELQMFAVCNAPTIGGGYPIAPGALIDDGLFDALLVRRMPTIEFVGVLQHIAVGEYQGDIRVRSFRAATCDLDFNREIHLNVDGEPLRADHCRYRVRHRAARFFCGLEPCANGRPVALASQ